jgi:hypothetical protein
MIDSWEGQTNNPALYDEKFSMKMMEVPVH